MPSLCGTSSRLTFVVSITLGAVRTSVLRQEDPVETKSPSRNAKHLRPSGLRLVSVQSTIITSRSGRVFDALKFRAGHVH